VDILVLGGFGIPATAPLNNALDRSARGGPSLTRCADRVPAAALVAA
jgi:hypothetical protein